MRPHIPAFKIFSQRKALSRVSFVRMVPNLATVMAMCMGLSAIRFAFMQKFDLAAGAILIAAVLDALDGRLARLLGAASEFGAELDSFSDFVSFGVAPAIVMYFFSLHSWHGFGWGLCLFMAVCTGFRLARFNILSRSSEKPYWNTYFFTGVPAPAGAMIALFPLVLFYGLGHTWPSSPFFSAVFLVGAGLLMVSRLPTLSFKNMALPSWMVFPLLLMTGLMLSFLFSAPWETLTFIILSYIALLPFGYHLFKKKEAYLAHHTSSSKSQSQQAVEE